MGQNSLTQASKKLHLINTLTAVEQGYRRLDEEVNDLKGRVCGLQESETT